MNRERENITAMHFGMSHQLSRNKGNVGSTSPYSERREKKILVLLSLTVSPLL